MRFTIQHAIAGVAAFVGALLVSRRIGPGLGGWTVPIDPNAPEGPPGGGDGGSGLGPVEPFADKDTATGFDPTPKEGTKLFRQWMIQKFGERPGSPQNIGRWDKTDKPSEHHEGRAWDQMTTDLAQGQAAVDALLAEDSTGEPAALARRFGVMYLIWNRQQWRAYPWQGNPAGSWAPYTGPNPHTDHVHYSLSRAGGNGELSGSIMARRDLGVA